MAVLVRSGRAAVVEAIAAFPIHIAWGTGDPDWGDAPPPEDVRTTALINEVGRRVALDIGYATPDDQGDIVVPTGRFARVPDPTNHLYLKFQYGFEDGAEHVIRELGVFVGMQMKEGLPPGQRYFLPDDIEHPGTLWSSNTPHPSTAASPPAKLLSSSPRSKGAPMTVPQNYYNHHDPAKGYVRQLYLAGRGIQSAEFNELQDIIGDHVSGIGNALLSDGDIVEGCECVVAGENVTVDAGRVYLRGMVRAMGNAAFQVPESKTRHVGVWYEEKVITHLEDPSLVDPAIATRNYQEPGAARTQALLSWGLDTDERPGSEFYPVHTIIDGVLLIKAPPPQLDSVTTALARYDRESNGSYVVEGLGVTVVSADGGNQVYSIAEGKAHIDGFELELPASLRLARPDNLPTTQSSRS